MNKKEINDNYEKIVMEIKRLFIALMVLGGINLFIIPFKNFKCYIKCISQAKSLFEIILYIISIILYICISLIAIRFCFLNLKILNLNPKKMEKKHETNDTSDN